MKSDTLLPQDSQTPSPSRSRRQFLVSDPQSAWIVKSGFVDVFVMSVRSEDPDGVPRHLARLKENDVLFGVDMAIRQLALVGASAPSTVITRTTVDEVLASENGMELLERWVDVLLQPIIGSTESRVVQRIQPDAEIRADEEDLGVAAETGLVWAETIAGLAYCSGHPEMELTPASPSFPIGRKSCLELRRGGAIKGRNTAALRDSGELPSSLALCGEFLAQALLAERERFAELEAKRLASRAEADEHVFRNALAVLSSPLSRVAAPPASDGGAVAEHPIFTACRIVGRQLGMAMKNHPDLRPGARISNAIEGIAKASSARTRKVLLRGRWWRADHGPLVAFWEHSGEPVALLRKNGRGYVAVDPATGKSQPVTAKVAALLAPFANTFYTPLPPRPLNGWDLAHFSFQVCRRELSIISAMGIGMGLLALLPPYLTGVVLDEIVPSARHSELLNVVLFLFVSMFTTALFTLVRSFATLRMQTKLDSSLQAAVWDRLLSLPAQFFRRFTAGDLAQRSMGINAIRQALTGSLLFSIFSGVFSIVSLGLLFYYDWRLAFAGLGLILVAFLFSVGCGYAQVKQERQVQRLKGAISGMVLQFISGVSKLRVSATEKRAFAVWAKAFGEQRRTAMKARRAANWVAVFNPVYPVFCAMVFYGYESYLSSDGTSKLSTGEFLAFMATFTQFLTAVLTLSAAFISALGLYRSMSAPSQSWPRYQKWIRRSPTLARSPGRSK